MHAMTTVDPSRILTTLTNFMRNMAFKFISKWLRENGEYGLYQKILKQKLNLTDLAVDSGRGQERDEYTGIIQRIKWSSHKIDEVAEELVEKYQCIPSHEWLRLNGFSAFATHMTHEVSRNRLLSCERDLGKP